MEILKGYVEDIIFYNEQNAYGVFSLLNGNDKVTCVGNVIDLRCGEILEAEGEWITHKVYGKQFSIKNYKKEIPKDEDAIIKYLSSGLVPGIGPKTAIKIVDHFGENTKEILENEPERLSEIKGLTKEKAKKIGKAIKEQRVLADIVIFFNEYSISNTIALKAYRTLKEEALTLIKKNPYLLIGEEIGLSFKQADRLAAGIGVEKESLDRVNSGIKFVLYRASTAGHTYLKLENLIAYSRRILGVSTDLIGLAIPKLVEDEILKNVNDKIYLNKYYYFENYVATRIISLSKQDFMYKKDSLEKALENTLKFMKITLDDTQKNACKTALFKGISIISGGPGTGKTTIIKVLIDAFSQLNMSFVLAAPTGRAAKKMEDHAKHEAKTIHRLLEIDFKGEGADSTFLRNEYNPLECDVIIIDEVSMVDIELMDSLLKALPIGGKIILIGDVNQLPAVGPGRVLGDLIDSKAVECVFLDNIYRQEQMSSIPLFSQNVNKGQLDEIKKETKDIQLLECFNADEILNTIQKVYKEEIKKGNSVQIISPGKKDLCGVINLNSFLQEKVNKQDILKDEKKFITKVFRLGDKVMQIKNNYNINYRIYNEEGTGVYNGDMGYIVAIDNQEQVIEVVYDEEKRVVYPFTDLDQLDLAYAITVHKSQGSEYDSIIMPLYDAGKFLLSRNLLYTGVTRAKKQIYFVGNKRILNTMVNNNKQSERNSGLLDMILGEL